MSIQSPTPKICTPHVSPTGLLNRDLSKVKALLAELQIKITGPGFKPSFQIANSARRNSSLPTSRPVKHSMKLTIFNTFIAALIFSLSTVNAAEPFTKAETLELPTGFSVAHAQAAINAPFVALNDGGLDFWLFDARRQKFKHITKNVVGDWDHRLHHTQWSEGNLVLFRSWEGVIDIINPDDMSTKISFSADLKSAPLRMSQWISAYSMLVDGTDFYRDIEGKLIKPTKPNPHAHSVQTGLLIKENKHVITSGFHDESIKVWSLPEGEFLHSWDIGTWFSKRRITAIALSYGRLLVGTEAGHLEERSLATGEKLWSARPCRNQVNFHYSSQFPPSLSVNVNDVLFFSCGSRIGYIEPQKNEWLISDLNTVLNEVMTRGAEHKTSKLLFAIETISDTELAVFIFSDGTSVVINKKQNRVLQKLANVKPGTAPVSYIAAAKQLFLSDAQNLVHLYKLDNTVSD